MIVLRKEMRINFKVHLAQTPFDSFEIPFEVEISSNKSRLGTRYAFSCYRNYEKSINLTITEKENYLHDFSIRYD